MSALCWLQLFDTWRHGPSVTWPGEHRPADADKPCPCKVTVVTWSIGPSANAYYFFTVYFNFFLKCMPFFFVSWALRSFNLGLASLDIDAHFRLLSPCSVWFNSVIFGFQFHVKPPTWVWFRGVVPLGSTADRQGALPTPSWWDSLSGFTAETCRVWVTP